MGHSCTFSFFPIKDLVFLHHQYYEIIKKVSFMNKLVLLIILLIVFSCGNHRSQETGKPNLNDYSVGEKWTWKWESAVNGEVRGEGKDIQEVVNYKGALALWNGFDTVRISDILNKKTSSTPFRDWPLKVGKKWKYESEWVNESGQKGITSQQAEVVSIEELEVIAGKFMTYKIKYNGFIENYEAGGKGEVTDTFWYCPELKTSIKHIQKGANNFMYTSELIEYAKEK